MNKIKIKLDKGVTAPEYATPGSAAVDLVANIDKPIVLRPGDAAVLIPTGISLDMTDMPNLCALILPRSGNGHKKGLVLGNGVGLIDNDYQGEIMVSALNRNPAVLKKGMGIVQPNLNITIEPGMRLAQLMFTGFTKIDEFEVVKSFEATKRGAGGFGSTGTKGRKSA